MGFPHCFWLPFLVVVIPNCIASPFSSTTKTPSTHGRRSSQSAFDSIPDDTGDYIYVKKRASSPSTPPGYSPDGRCGPSNGGLMCDPNSTFYSGTCCSNQGWCGSTIEYCGNGCVSGCFNRATQNLGEATAAGRCGSSFGGRTCDADGPYGGCCSSEGWCGSTSAYCDVGEGCQSGCNPSASSKSRSMFTSSSRKASSASSTAPERSPSSRLGNLVSTSTRTSLLSTSSLSRSTFSSTASWLTTTTTLRSSAKTICCSSPTPTAETFRSIVTSQSYSVSTGEPWGTRSSVTSLKMTSHPTTSTTSTSTSTITPTTISSTSSNVTLPIPSNSNTTSTSISSKTSVPLFITVGGVPYAAIQPSITSTTSSTSSVASIIMIDGISYKIVGSTLSSQSFSSHSTMKLLPSSPSTNSTISASSSSPSSSVSLSSSASLLSPSASVSTSTLSATRSATGPTFSPSNAAQAACADPFQTFPNGTNGLGLTIDCFMTLNISEYLNEWIATNYPKVCTGSQDFSTCFTQYLGIFDAGTDCTGIKTGSCTGFNYGSYAHMNWDVRDIYILQSIYGINQYFASWYNGLLGAQSGASLTIGAIINRVNPPKTSMVSLNDILATLSLGLSIFTLPDDIVKAVQGLEEIENAIRASPGFIRAFTPEKTTNPQIQIGQIQASLGNLVSQFLTQISNATAAIETNATTFATWASTGVFIGGLVVLDQAVQDNYKMLNTYILGEALNANNIVATVGLNTNVQQLQANTSAADSLSYDIKCPGYDNNTMCNGWWYDQEENASFALDDLNSMSRNMQDDLTYFFDNGWTNGSLLFEGALKCQQSGGGSPTLNLSPGTTGSMAQCFSSVKLCTWNLGCALDASCEFKECPTQSGFGVNGCGSDDNAIYDFNVPYNYLGTFLTDANPVSEVCNDGP